MANFRQRLLQFLQGVLHETPRIRYSFSWLDNELIRATVYVGENTWTGQPRAHFMEAKDSAAHAAYTELSALTNEALLRQRLGLQQIQRNFDIQVIRRALTTLKRDLRNRPDYRQLLCRLSQIYPIVDDLESRLQ